MLNKNATKVFPSDVWANARISEKCPLSVCILSNFCAFHCLILPSLPADQTSCSSRSLLNLTHETLERVALKSFKLNLRIVVSKQRAMTVAEIQAPNLDRFVHWAGCNQFAVWGNINTCDRQRMSVKREEELQRFKIVDTHCIVKQSKSNKLSIRRNSHAKNFVLQFKCFFLAESQTFSKINIQWKLKPHKLPVDFTLQVVLPENCRFVGATRHKAFLNDKNKT